MNAAAPSCILLFARSSAADARRKAVPGAEAVFQLARERVVRAARALGVDLVVVGPGIPEATVVLPQRGDTFGSRLAAAFEDTRRLGYRRIVAVGNDTPALQQNTIARAFAALSERAVVLGPSDDGGVYLIGAASPIETQFGDVRWCGRHTHRDLLRLAPEALVLHALPDLDAGSDLARLAACADPVLVRLVRALRPAPPLTGEPRVRVSEAAKRRHPIRGPPA